MTIIEGNEQFQASIEFSTLAEVFLGKRWHLVVQFFLYMALQSLVVTSLIESFQVSNAFFFLKSNLSIPWILARTEYGRFSRQYSAQDLRC